MDTKVVQETLVIKGGKPLNGEVKVRGAKNSVSKIMVASLLTDKSCTLYNVPNIEDVEVVTAMIQAFGGKVERKDGSLTIHNENLESISPKKLHAIAGKSRIPILFAGPLLHRMGEVELPGLGGCKIGPRPVNFHLAALEKMGAKTKDIENGFSIEAKEGLEGTKIKLEYPSVGATEQILLASVLARGKTELSNAAMEPEIIDLISVLQKMGAIITVDTDRVIRIEGVKKLFGFNHHVIPDRLEAASWACVAFATDGRIFVKNAQQLNMMTFLNMYRKIGGMFTIKEDGIEFWRGKHLYSIALETDVYPGFSTDWQQPFSILLTMLPGASIIHETVYESRFGYTAALNEMGAHIQIYRDCLGGNTCRFGQKNHLHSAVVTGPSIMHGSDIIVPDLRAGFSYVIAALAAKGESKISQIDIIKRGYENFTQKLTDLGADVVLA